jgi:hypothetical protein
LFGRFEKQAQMTVDDGPELISFSPGDLVQLNVESALYIGQAIIMRTFGTINPVGFKIYQTLFLMENIVSKN